MTIELIRGNTYRAKKPACVGTGYVNDRMIVYMSLTQVQYDSPGIPNGQRYKFVPVEEFLKWAGRDVTAEMPKDEWMPYGRGIK